MGLGGEGAHLGGRDMEKLFFNREKFITMAKTANTPLILA
jgi:hypothetical protein